MIEYHNPDVVLVDLKLPGMDGDEVLKRVRETKPNVKVIVITAYRGNVYSGSTMNSVDHPTG